MLTAEFVRANLPRLLPLVARPGRYTGGELNSFVKAWEASAIRVCLVFPDLYEVGMSNLGVAILYDSLNRRADTLAERAYCPWHDMEEAMRRAGVPLFSLESKQPLANFDILGFSLPSEQLYSNVLLTLDLAGVPLLAEQRGPEHPLVIAGGHAVYNPEPLADFVDACVIGEGEEVIHEIVDVYGEWKSGGKAAKADLLERLARIGGVYVPALYSAAYNSDGTVAAVTPRRTDIPARISKRIVPILPPPATRLIVPYIDVIHNRLPIEIMRGCTRGCRFCQAGMVTRPVRERSVADILQAIEDGLSATGFEEISLLSLSSSDYTQIIELVRQVSERWGSRHLSISLPSLRLETASVELMETLAGNKHGGFTFAPEAAAEQMRAAINKPLPAAQLLEVARAVFARGWVTIKLYFMIGHPGETTADVRDIAELCCAVIAEGRKIMGKKASVHAAISPFVPKPHTPFQWAACDSIEAIEAKLALLKRDLRGPGLKLNWHDPRLTQVEAWLSRGDRRLGRVILEAWKRGAHFDAWQECFDYAAWEQAFAAAGLDPTFYTRRPRQPNEVFPWDHIDVGVRKEFLLQDYEWSRQGRRRADCREQCYACGVNILITKRPEGTRIPAAGLVSPCARPPAASI